MLSHGVGENSDRLVRDAYLPMAKKTPVAIGFGMAMMSSSHLQSAVDDLRAAGVRRIILWTQGTTTKYNSLTRHWQYIFGMYPESSYMDVPKIKAPGVEFVWAGHFNDHPLITEMLYEGALSVSTEPRQRGRDHRGPRAGRGGRQRSRPEDHPGPRGPDKGEEEVRRRPVSPTSRTTRSFPVRESNVRKLRAMIQQATKAGRKVIVVPIAAASYGVQRNIKTDLRGLQYTFAEKGLIENPKFMQWVDSVIKTAEARSRRPTCQSADVNDQNLRPLLLILFVGVLMGALDLAIIGPALPAIQADLGLDTRALAWIFNIYVLFQLMGTPLMAKLSDRYGRRVHLRAEPGRCSASAR